MRTLSILTLLVLMLGFTGPARAQGCGMYTCIDKNGVAGFQNVKYRDSEISKSCKYWEPKGRYGTQKPTQVQVWKCKDQEPTNKDGVPTIVRPSKNPSTVRRPRSSSGGARGTETGSIQDRMALYEPYIEEANKAYEIPTEFIRAVMRVESAFSYKAVSGAGAQGLMQLMPRTARSMGVNDSFDPRQNIMGGTRFLRILANKYDGDMVKVLSAYNAGAGAVKKKGGIPYEGTEGYVRAVLDHYYRYKAL